MSEAKIFLLDDSGKNVSEMVEVPYEAEEVLQRLLVVKPGLLPGDQINPENPRDWLLVKREMGVPGEVDEGDRWSLDHLFLDQDGIPTFVEANSSLRLHKLNSCPRERALCKTPGMFSGS